MNKDQQLLSNAYNRVVLFEQTTNSARYFLKEHFYMKDDDGQVVFDNNNIDDNTALGDVSQVPQLNVNGFKLVGRFDGTNKQIRGDETSYLHQYKSSHSANFFVGYRTIDDLQGGREAVMSALKGAANYLEFDQDNIDNNFAIDLDTKNRKQLFTPQDQYYHKDFYGLTETEYVQAMNKGINAFVAQNDNITYDYVVYPSGRSKNAQHIARILAARVGSANVEVVELQKLLLDDADERFYNIFRYADLIRSFTRFMPNVSEKDIERALRQWLSVYAQGNKRGSQTRLGDEISTASNLRSQRLDNIYADILQYPYIQAAMGNVQVQGVPGGRLDSFADSHMNPEQIAELVDKINHPYQQELNRVANERQSAQSDYEQKKANTLVNIAGLQQKIQSLEKQRIELGKKTGLGFFDRTQFLSSPVTPSGLTQKDIANNKNKIIDLSAEIAELKDKIFKRQISVRAPFTPPNIVTLDVRAKILFVDDNINTGDMYKQLKPIVEKTANFTSRIQFFFLLCRETYAV